MEVLAADLQGVLLIDKEKILAKFKDELLDMTDNSRTELLFTVSLRHI